MRGEASVFHNRFADFIFAEVGDEIEDGLTVVRYAQRDARFWGAEASAVVDLLHDEPHHLDVESGTGSSPAEPSSTSCCAART